MKQVTMFVFGLLSLLSACPAFAEEPAPSAWESALLDQAATCAEVTPKTRTMLLKMLRIEADQGLPEHVRGITVAIACVEAKYNPKAEGDHKFSKDGKSPMAIGLFQMWPFWKSVYKVDRRDPYAATKVWLSFVKDRLAYVERTCKPKSEEQKWASAVAYSMMGPGKRCRQKSSHHRLLDKWHSSMDDEAATEVTAR